MATLALAQDNAFGQPLESQLRSCLLSTWLGEAAGFDQDTRDTTYWVALLRYIGCTGHAHEVSTLFGDEIAIRARTLVHDGGNPAAVMQDVFAYATAGHPPGEGERITAWIKAHGHDWAVNNFASGCEVGDVLLRRLYFAPAVREALRHTFERWSGTGFPAGVAGLDIPLAMRTVHLCHDMEAISRRLSPAAALEAALDRRDRTYDPALADLFRVHGEAWFGKLSGLDPWDAVLALEPGPRPVLEGARLDEALEVAADFIDLKSPYMGGHSRRCAQLCTGAAQRLGLTGEATDRLRRAALLHDFGTTAIPNSIWDKPGALTRAEVDRVALHPMITERMLRRAPCLAELGGIAAAHHEKSDGSGYHKGVRLGTLEQGAAVLAAADIYAGLTADRADRVAWTPEGAAAELQRLVAAGQLEAAAAQAVLAVAGHDQGDARPPDYPAGLSRREAEVLRLAARGLTTRQIAEQLHISAKTADHHIQHVYAKIQVSTRAAAALWAMQHGIVG